MHRCLLIQEILQIISMGVGTDPCRNLLAMALVCHDFFDASMDHLWRDVPDLFPLLGCLPSDIWRTPLSYDRIADAALVRAITPADLERFRIYARRVRALHDRPLQIPADIYQALSLALQGQPIFPNLINLPVVRELTVLPYINMLLGPRIRRIILDLSSNPTLLSDLLPMLGKRYPALLQFDLEAEYNPDVGRQMNHILPGWTQLQVLTVPHLPEESLRVVATLPQLIYLSLTRVDSKFGDAFSPISGRPVFQRLQRLSVKTNTFTPCISLLRATTNCPLHGFSFHLYEAPTSDMLDWHNLFSALVGSCDRTAVGTICVGDFDIESYEWGTRGTTDQLRPLLLLTNLTYVYLGIRSGFNVDDDFLREMAAAWPHLRDLDIGTICWDPLEQQRLTLQGLAPLAEFCPDLRILTANINATHSCFNHISSGSSPSSSRLETLMVDRSPISQSSVPWAAAYLSEVFPRLHTIDWISPEDDDEDDEGWVYPNRWSEVMNLLPAYRKIHGHQ